MKAEFRAGDLLAKKFRVQRVLGRGGMGVVLACTDEKLGRPVALKLMLPAALAAPGFAQRFLAEARNASRLESSHAVPVWEVGELDDGSPFIAMPLLEGEDLAVCLEREKRLEVAEAVGFVLQACEALAEAHALGIVHRDLKPANLFVDRSRPARPSIRVLDFGIAKEILASKSAAARATEAGLALGTPYYMAPEQRRGSPPVDARCDIWALGVVLYELLAGTPPFVSDDPIVLHDMVMSQAPKPLRDARAGVDAGLSDVVMKCLEKDRGDRWADVAKLAAALIPFGPADAHASATVAAEALRATVPLAIPVERRAEVAAFRAGASKPPLAAPAPPPWMGVMPEIDYADESKLLQAVSTRDRVTFVFGSALTMPYEGRPGVPRVAEIIDLVRSEYHLRADIDEFDAALDTPGMNRYQAAFRHLLQTRGLGVVNRVIRKAVLQARRLAPKDDLVKRGIAGDEQACEELDADLEGWYVSKGATALGALVNAHPERFGRLVLTSNFDPLIEIAIQRAGGTCFPTALDTDGKPSQSKRSGCNVVHFHGYWFGSATLHTPTQLGQDRPHLRASLRKLLEKGTLVVLGYGGWDDVFTRTLLDFVRGDALDLLWTFFKDDPVAIARDHAPLLHALRPGIEPGYVNLYKGVDCHRFLDALRQRMEVAAPPPTEEIHGDRRVEANGVAPPASPSPPPPEVRNDAKKADPAPRPDKTDAKSRDERKDDAHPKDDGAKDRPAATKPREETAGTKPPPTWALIAGCVFGGVTLLFFMAILVMSAVGLTVKEQDTPLFALVSGMSFGLTSSFLGGYARVTGKLPLPFGRAHPVTIALSGGIAFAFVGWYLGMTTAEKMRAPHSNGATTSPELVPSGSPQPFSQAVRLVVDGLAECPVDLANATLSLEWGVDAGVSPHAIVAKDCTASFENLDPANKKRSVRFGLAGASLYELADSAKDHALGLGELRIGVRARPFDANVNLKQSGGPCRVPDGKMLTLTVGGAQPFTREVAIAGCSARFEALPGALRGKQADFHLPRKSVPPCTQVASPAALAGSIDLNVAVAAKCVCLHPTQMQCTCAVACPPCNGRCSD